MFDEFPHCYTPIPVQKYLRFHQLVPYSLQAGSWAEGLSKNICNSLHFMDGPVTDAACRIVALAMVVVVAS
ncbi:hypothetical protein EJB05_25664 [Eragrostis curvula]|uniref:Uncharacterized protein n=1 Tax=Eragrostis curvula TaxID=38414 RepID=A0A5J9UJ66_9POAL|nr:hypothetical protein EJB05_25664 [Eragrostis curvula]